MRKYLINIVQILIILTCIVVAGIGSCRSHNYSVEVKPPEVVPERLTEDEIIMIEQIAIRESDMAYMFEIPEIRYSNFDEEIFFLNLTPREQELLEEIAMAEAKGEGSKGMALVMCVVLNRAKEWNRSIEDIIFASGQFYTQGMEPGNDACHEALAMVMEGWDESEGALFFNKYGYRSGKEPLFQYGAHYFSK